MSSILPLIFSLALLSACGKHTQSGSGTQGVTNTIQVQAETLATMIMEEDLKGLQHFVAAGGDVNAELASGRTLLTEACEWKKYKVISFLVKNKVDLTRKDRIGKTAEDYAAEDANIGNAMYPERLIELQQKLILAAKSDPKGEFKAMLAQGPNVDFFITTEVADAEGESFLTYMVKQNLFLAMRFLVAAKLKIDVNLPNAKGQKPLKIARELKLTNFEKLLLTLGATE